MLPGEGEALAAASDEKERREIELAYDKTDRELREKQSQGQARTIGVLGK